VLCLVNFGPEPRPLPPHHTVLLASADLAGDPLSTELLPTDTAVWLRLHDH
jgi:alpha-glucosidase